MERVREEYYSLLGSGKEISIESISYIHFTFLMKIPSGNMKRPASNESFELTYLLILQVGNKT